MAIPRSKANREKNLNETPGKRAPRHSGEPPRSEPRSMELPDAEDEAPGPRGAREKQSEVQGSE